MKMQFYLLLIIVSIISLPSSAQWLDILADETSTTTPAAPSITTTTTSTTSSNSNSSNNIKYTSFTLTACVTASDVTLPNGVTFTPVLSTTHCAMGCQDACAAVLVATEVGGSKTCAVLARTTHIPVSQSVTCADDSATVAVYTSNVDTSPTCHANITVWEDLTCLHDSGLVTRSYTEARAHCESMGGTLPEVETIPDVDAIKGLFGSLNYTFIWLGATDPNGENIFLFASGHEVPANLWESNETNNSNENCTAIAWYGSRKVIDFGCEDLSYDMKVVCAFSL